MSRRHPSEDLAAYLNISVDQADAHIRLAIRMACCSFQGYERRWARIREKRPEDKDLKSYVGREFGEMGGFSGSDIPFTIYYHGNANPVVRLVVRATENQKVEIKGKRLLRYVREEMSVPSPHDLFEGAT